MAVLRNARRVPERRIHGLRQQALMSRDPLAGGIGSAESDRGGFLLGHRGMIPVSRGEGPRHCLDGGFGRAEVGGEALLKAEPRIDVEYREFKSTLGEHGENLQSCTAGVRDPGRILLRSVVLIRREWIEDKANELSSSPVLVDKSKIVEPDGRSTVGDGQIFRLEVKDRLVSLVMYDEIELHGIDSARRGRGWRRDYLLRAREEKRSCESSAQQYARCKMIAHSIPHRCGRSLPISPGVFISTEPMKRSALESRIPTE